jgi:hypothetical protein
MSAVASLILSMTGKVVKETTTQYRDEQSRLLAKSYTEYAIMAVINYDRDAPSDCIETIDAEINSLNAGETPSASVTTCAAPVEVQFVIEVVRFAAPAPERPCGVPTYGVLKKFTRVIFLVSDADVSETKAVSSDAVTVSAFKSLILLSAIFFFI